MDIQVQIVYAFTDNDLGGNPAGVVLNADELNAQQMISITAKVGLSETAFVSSSNSAAYKLDSSLQIAPDIIHVRVGMSCRANEKGQTPHNLPRRTQ